MRSRSILVAWGAALLAVAPLSARLADARLHALGVVEPGAGAVVEAGRKVVARWDAAPEGAREMELLLSLDGGATFGLRLSAEIDPAQRTFTWQVPDLPSASARVALRAEIGGREVVFAESGDFTIAVPAGAVRRSAVRREAGELWSVDAPARSGEEPELPPAVGHRSRGADGPTAGVAVAEINPRVGRAALAASRSRHDGAPRAAASATPSVDRPRARTTVVVPLRI